MWCRSAVRAVGRLVLLPGCQVLQVGSQQDHSPWKSNIISMRSLIFQVDCSSHPPCPPSPRGLPPPPHCPAQPRWWGTHPARPIIVAKVEGMSSSFSSIISKYSEQPIPVDPVELSSTKPVLRPFQNLITVLTWHLSLTRQMKENRQKTDEEMKRHHWQTLAIRTQNLARRTHGRSHSESYIWKYWNPFVIRSFLVTLDIGRICPSPDYVPLQVLDPQQLPR